MSFMYSEIYFDEVAVGDQLDQLVAHIDAKFPVVEVTGDRIVVNASSDPDHYSVLMACIQAAEEIGVDGDVIV